MLVWNSLNCGPRIGASSQYVCVCVCVRGEGGGGGGGENGSIE